MFNSDPEVVQLVANYDTTLWEEATEDFNMSRRVDWQTVNTHLAAMSSVKRFAMLRILPKRSPLQEFGMEEDKMIRDELSDLLGKGGKCPPNAFISLEFTVRQLLLRAM